MYFQLTVFSTNDGLIQTQPHRKLRKSMQRRRQWHPTPVLSPGNFHGRRSLEGCSLWGNWGSDTTERLHFHFSLSCIGEGNGNPLQCSCLENPRDGGARWAAIFGVAQSRTRLKRLSSSSSSSSSWVLLFKEFWEIYMPMKFILLSKYRACLTCQNILEFHLFEITE